MDADEKACPVCGETIKAAALKCRFCNTDLTAYAATKASEAEADLFVGHPAIIYTVGQLMPFIVVIAVAILAGYLLNLEHIGDSGSNALYLILFVLAAFAVICIRYFARSRGIHYEITTQRIKLERGLLSKVQESLELFRVDHFELRKPLGQRLLGQAELHLFSSDAELENFYIYGVPNLESLADTLRDCQLRERARRGLTTFVKA
ncbi:MAG TPA: PH domain-containing protein [Terracidiphilus sp.]|nr:PH domain-containing protein [Terracidiphilus sp.]